MRCAIIGGGELARPLKIELVVAIASSPPLFVRPVSMGGEYRLVPQSGGPEDEKKTSVVMGQEG